MIPESKLIKSEIVVRDMSLPEDVKLTKKSLIRWVALSLGLISPNESRQMLLDILDTLVYFHSKKEAPSTTEIVDRLKESSKEEFHEKTVYYHLLKLKDAGVITRNKGKYYLGDGEWKPLTELFRELYIHRADKAFKNIEQALDKLQDSYSL